MNNKQYLNKIIKDCQEQIDKLSEKRLQAIKERNVEEMDAFEIKRRYYSFMKDRLIFNYKNK